MKIIYCVELQSNSTYIDKMYAGTKYFSIFFSMCNMFKILVLKS